MDSPRHFLSKTLLSAFTFVAMSEAHGTCFVRLSAAGANDGSSWLNAFTDLNDALKISSCTEIWVAHGVYKPKTAEGFSYVLGADRSLYGGFIGNEITRDLRDPKKNVTVLSGDIGDDDANEGINKIDQSPDDIRGQNTFPVLLVDGQTTHASENTVIDGFIITGGDNPIAGQGGGGMICLGSFGGQCEPTLRNLVFIGNRAAYAGGALYNDGTQGGVSSPTLQNVVFSHNSAGYAGGAMFNNALPKKKAAGDSSPHISNAIFDSNTASVGGAIYNYGHGGRSSPVFDSVTFSNNAAAQAGGALYNDGISSESSPVFTNVTFVRNSAPDGAVMLNDGEFGGFSNPSFINVTISDNHCHYDGAVMSSLDGDGGQSAPLLTDSIVWNNSCASGSLEFVGGLPFIDHSIVATGCPSGGTCKSLISGDPQLGTLTDNGGFSLTMMPGPAGAAINTGGSATCATVDQRGVSRSRLPCDVGAVERIPTDDTIFKNGLELY